MTALASEFNVIDRELETQHESCADMQRCVTERRQCLAELRPAITDNSRITGPALDTERLSTRSQT